MKIVNARQMQEIERAAVQAGVSLDSLMENAGRAIADALRDHLPTAGSGPALVLVGPGNNGGDGLVAARHLAARGISVTAYLFLARAAEDEKRDLAVEAGVEIVHASKDTDRSKLAAAAAGARVAVLSAAAAVDMSGIAAGFEDITDGLRTRGGMVDDLPSEIDPPTRSELGLADPISIGFLDFPQDPRR